MRLIESTWFVAAAAAVLACTSTESSRRPPSDLVRGLEAAAAASCACRDMACSNAVNQQVEILARGAGAVDPVDRPALQAAQARIDQCRVALNPRLVAYRGILDDACACQDPACATAVAKHVAVWGADLKASKETLRPGEIQLVLASAKAAAECFTRHGVPIPR